MSLIIMKNQKNFQQKQEMIIKIITHKFSKFENRFRKDYFMYKIYNLNSLKIYTE